MGESQVTYEANNVTPPLKNTTAMKCIAVLIATPASQVVDLNNIFGSIGNGHYFTAIADGVKVYVALGAASGTIDETAWGSSTLAVSTLACIPIPDGTQLPFRLIPGQEIATGVSTLTNYNYLHYKTAATGSSTGYLRLYRSSVSPNQDAGQFKGPFTGF